MTFKPNRKKFKKLTKEDIDRLLDVSAKKPKREKRHILKEKDMQILFHGFNETFFGNRINRTVKVRLVSPAQLRKINKYHEADAAWRPAVNEIWIDSTYGRSESIACLLLLHEMAHAALESTYVGHPTHNPGHGMIYQAELFRLFMAGAYDGLL